MKDDLNASEKRLIAALDRIDAFIDRAPEPRPDLAPDAGSDDALRAENLRLSQELAVLHERQAELLASYESRLADANERLNVAGDEAARLAAANDALIAANRDLTAAENPGADQHRAALEAEIKALRAARAAEIGQMDDIIGTLDRMLGKSDPIPAAPVMVESPMPLEMREPATETAADERD